MKEIIIKLVKNKWIYLNPRVSISIKETNICDEPMTFRSHMDIYWKVEVHGYSENCLTIRVKNYEINDQIGFEKQSSFKETIKKLHFQPFEWSKLEPLLSNYIKSKLINILPDSEESPLIEKVPFLTKPSLIEKQNNIIYNEDQFFSQKPQIDNKPTYREVTENFQIHFTDAHFMLGYVTFKKYLKEVKEDLTFKIFNDNILPEFENIKFWFPKKLKLPTKKFTVSATIILKDDEIIETKASSEYIDQITSELIDSVKYQRTLSLSKVRGLSDAEKSLFTADEIFNQMDTNDIEGNVFNQSEDDILNLFTEKPNIRNKKQLAYLAGKMQSENYKLRYTLSHHFGFLFFVEGVEDNHFVWELLNSNATYIWSFDKSRQIEAQFSRMEGIINIVRANGRENYKRAYRNNPQDDDLVFRLIKHESTGSAFIDGFPKWKSRLNEQLT